MCTQRREHNPERVEKNSKYGFFFLRNKIVLCQVRIIEKYKNFTLACKVKNIESIQSQSNVMYVNNIIQQRILS